MSTKKNTPTEENELTNNNFEDMNKIDTFNNFSQLNPGGELIVKIDFIRNQY